MAWFKIDDGFWCHPKIVGMSAEAVALWVKAGTWCSQQLTDGVVPKKSLGMFSATVEAAQELVSDGLWIEQDGVYVFHDWFDYQPSAYEVASLREKRAEAGRRGGYGKASKSQANAMASAKANAVANDLANGVAKRKQNSAPSPYPYPYPSPSPYPYPDPNPYPDPSPSPYPSPYPYQYPLEESTSIEVSSSKRETRLSATWAPTAEHIKRAQDTHVDLMLQVEKFKAHAEEHDRKAKNWNAAFTRWLINAAEYAEKDQRRDATANLTRGQRAAANDMERYLARERAGQQQLHIEGGNQ